MAEEVRFFLRTALYTAVIGVVYWYLSYEVAGSVMLGFVAAATGVIVFVVVASVRAARGDPAGSSGGPVARIGRFGLRVVGFTEPTGEADHEPLAAGLDPLPRSSPWPFAGGIAAFILGLGLVYGPWLILPGIAAIVGVLLGWLTQYDRPS
jgi:hypothetical protein